MSLVHPLARYRAETGKTPDALAADLGVAGLTVKRWEAGEVLPQGRVREKIKDVTGIRFSEFVAFLEARTPA